MPKLLVALTLVLAALLHPTSASAARFAESKLALGVLDGNPDVCIWLQGPVQRDCIRRSWPARTNLAPDVRVFLSQDPVFGDLANPMTLQGFTYANANPTMYTDPDGRFIRDLFGGIIGETLDRFLGRAKRDSDPLEDLHGSSSSPSGPSEQIRPQDPHAGVRMLGEGSGVFDVVRGFLGLEKAIAGIKKTLAEESSDALTAQQGRQLAGAGLDLLSGATRSIAISLGLSTIVAEGSLLLSSAVSSGRALLASARAELGALGAAGSRSTRSTVGKSSDVPFIAGPIKEGQGGYIFRGDDYYRGGDISTPMRDSVEAEDIIAHVTAKTRGERVLTSFSTVAGSKGPGGTSGAGKFGDQVLKVARKDLDELARAGQIRTITPEDAREIIAGHPKSKISEQAPDVYDIMRRNNEVLIMGNIPRSSVKRVK